MSEGPIVLIGDGKLARDARAHAEAIGVRASIFCAGSDSALAALLQEQNAAGILPLEKGAATMAARAAAQMQLPTVSPEAAKLVQDRHTLYTQLRAAGIRVPDHELAVNEMQLRRVMNRWGGPVVLRPRHAGTAGRGVMRIDHAADLGLGLAKAQKYDPAGEAVIECYKEGATYVVEGLVHHGKFQAIALMSAECASPPFLHRVGLALPAQLDGPHAAKLVEQASSAARALGVNTGPFAADCILDGGEPCIVSAGLAPGDSALRGNLALRAFGSDYLGDCLRVAAGKAPQERMTRRHAAALFWIPCRSGVVTAIEGVEEAKAVPGVEELHIAVKPGECIGHIVDDASRDCLGYVVAVAEDTAAAIAAAKTARNLCRFVRRPALGND